MPSAPETRPSLVVRLRNARDAAAWTEFLQVYEPLILRLMARNGLQDCDARDVCQQVLAAVAHDVAQWQPDGAQASFRRWLFQIARHRAIKFVMRERRRTSATGGTEAQLLLDAQPEFDAAASAEFDLEYRQQLLRCAAEQVRSEFRESTWEAFRRTCIEGHTVAEVAAELGTTAGNVYVARSRVIASLRKRVMELQQPDV